MIAVGDSRSDLPSSDNEKDGDDEDNKDSVLVKLSEDDESN